MSVEYPIAVAVERTSDLAARVAALIRSELPEHDPLSVPIAACVLATAAATLDGVEADIDKVFSGGVAHKLCQICEVLGSGIRS